MPNYNQHLKTGAVVGGLSGAGLYVFRYYQAKDENPKLKFTWGEFMLYTMGGISTGALCSILADKLEPASSPNHRGFFHSITFETLLLFSIYKMLNKENDSIWKDIAFFAVAGYILTYVWMH